MSILPLLRKNYFGNVKYIEANVQALDALKHTLRKEYLFMVSHCDSAFAVWNTFNLSQATNGKLCGERM